jgi:hypothetical protein
MYLNDDSTRRRGDAENAEGAQRENRSTLCASSARALSLRVSVVSCSARPLSFYPLLLNTHVVQQVHLVAPPLFDLDEEFEVTAMA